MLLCNTNKGTVFSTHRENKQQKERIARNSQETLYVKLHKRLSRKHR